MNPERRGIRPHLLQRVLAHKEGKEALRKREEEELQESIKITVSDAACVVDFRSAIFDGKTRDAKQYPTRLIH